MAGWMEVAVVIEVVMLEDSLGSVMRGLLRRCNNKGC